MKRLLLLILLLPLTVFAQHEFGYHATWYFSYGGIGEFGYKKVSHIGDTTMLGMHWLEFEVTGLRAIKTGPNPNDVVVLDSSKFYSPIFLATRNDSVFRLWDNNTPYLLYDFSAQLGDEWQFAPDDSFAGCDSLPIVTVNKIGVDTIDGHPMDFMHVLFPMDTVYYGSTPFYQPMSNATLNPKVYPQFGGVLYVSLFQAEPNTCDGRIVDWTYHTLSCFSNDSLSISLTNQPCDFVPFISVDEYEAVNFEVYPNPTNDLISLKTDEEVKNVEVYSLEGQKLLETKNTESIQLPSSSGMYLIIVWMEDGKKAMSKVIKE
ncbi:T9SS type A sorting domain-containing protein [Owenweeksia hongkongensis]|uniref:T9SS type A sorting domain-containing protein n=1 Tax=Owenweeksia hongkongensis TaxID=253245 RepID=UPI003A928081